MSGNFCFALGVGVARFLLVVSCSRRAWQLSVLASKRNTLQHKVRFIQLVCQGAVLAGASKSRADIESALAAHGLPPFSEEAVAVSVSVNAVSGIFPGASFLCNSFQSIWFSAEVDESTPSSKTAKRSVSLSRLGIFCLLTFELSSPFEYLLNLPLASLTKEKSDAFESELAVVTNEFELLTKKTVGNLF